IFFLLLSRALRSTLFPYTTLFRSIEFYVGNAKQAAYYYINAFGFTPLAYAGPETGVRDKASYAVRQNKLIFVLTAPIKPNTEIRSEEHTSELQSRFDLVCRLLLEK